MEDSYRTQSIASGLIDELSTSNYLAKATKQIVTMQMNDAQETLQLNSKLNNLIAMVNQASG